MCILEAREQILWVFARARLGRGFAVHREIFKSFAT